MTLSLYIARRFPTSVGQVFMVFFGILLLIDMIEQLRRFSGNGVGLSEALHLSLFNVPETLYRILPLILIMGAIALFLSLARSSELVVVRAAGRSGLRFLATPVLAAIGIGLFTIGVLNPLVAATQKNYDDLRSSYLQDGASTLSVSDTGLWLRQGGEYGQTVIQAARANLDGTELFDVSFLTFGPDGTPATRIEAAKARLQPGAWVLDGAKVWDLTTANPERAALHWPDATRLASDLTADRIRDSFGTLGGADLGPARLYRRPGKSRLFGPRLPAVVSDGTGAAAPAYRNGADRGRLHHAPCPLWRHRHHGALCDVVGICHLLS